MLKHDIPLLILWTELMSWLSGVREGYHTCRQPTICPAQAAACYWAWMCPIHGLSFILKSWC